jgi:PAS domain S-box-containing protein
MPQANTATQQSLALSFLPKHGEMAALIRSYDWDDTSIGPIHSWPQSLRTAINIALLSPVPIVMLWGKDGIMIYNDAYSAFAGARHPTLLGSKVLEGWPEVADFNANVMEHGMRGETLSYNDQQLTLYRNNVAEEVWMNLSYSPIFNEAGKPAGIFAIVVETTQRVLAEKKQREAEADLELERQKLERLFRNTPAFIAVMSGPQHIYTLANSLYLKIVGSRKIIGKPIREALPELEGTGLYEIIAGSIYFRQAIYRQGSTNWTRSNRNWRYRTWLL